MTQKWVAKFCQVGRQNFSLIFIFCHLFVNWIKIWLTSYHCSRSFPLSCKAHQNFDNAWLCHPHPSWTALTSNVSLRKCQNVPLNGQSPCKLVSLPCFLTCYTLFIFPIQTSSIRSSSQDDFVVTRSLRRFGNCALALAAPGWSEEAAGLHLQKIICEWSPAACSK